MGRPVKEGLDGWTFDTSLLDDPKIRLVRRKHGAMAVLVTILLYNRIYLTHGYYVEWNTDTAELIAADAGDGCTPELVKDIVMTAIEKELFSQTLFDKYGVLTSHGIQMRYIEFAKRNRDRIRFASALWLLTKEDTDRIPTKVREKFDFVKLSGDLIERTRPVAEAPPMPDEPPDGTSDIVPINDYGFFTKDENFGKCYRYYADHINPNCGRLVIDQMKTYSDQMDAEIIIRAIDIAIAERKTNWSYIRGILRNVVSLGISKWADYQAYEEERNRGQQRPRGTAQSSRMSALQQLAEIAGGGFE